MSYVFPCGLHAFLHIHQEKLSKLNKELMDEKEQARRQYRDLECQNAELKVHITVSATCWSISSSSNITWYYISLKVKHSSKQLIVHTFGHESLCQLCANSVSLCTVVKDFVAVTSCTIIIDCVSSNVSNKSGVLHGAMSLYNIIIVLSYKDIELLHM